MRKTIAAVTVGLLLVAGQAAAANELSTARVGDRVGARADAASGFQAEAGTIMFAQNTWVVILGVATLVAAGTVISTDGCTSGCS